VLVDVNLFSSLSQQLLVKRPGFAFVADVEYEQLATIYSFL